MLEIKSVADLQVGDIGFSTIGGRIGPWVAIGQALLRDECWFTHTYIVIEQIAGAVVVLEAMPHGARLTWLKGDERCRAGHGWIRLPLSESQRVDIEDARKYAGIPYSFLDYLSLALLHLGLPRKLTAGRVTSSGHMICSQLVDHVLCEVDFHLFDDGRLSQDVTPGALFRRAGALGEVMWW
jgi:hypothetical protein